MGAWGTGYFANDGALDFLGDVSARGWQGVGDAFAAAARHAGDDLDMDVGAAALAGAALVAAKLSQGDMDLVAQLDLHPDASEIVAAFGALPDGFRARAYQTVLQVGFNGELAGAWAEAAGDDFEAFKASIDLLLHILEPI